jgi:alkyl hydroperoxide reductase subunit AhpC
VKRFERALSQLEAQNTQVLGISTDTHHSHRIFAQQCGGVSYPLLSDFEPKGEVAKAYGVYNDAQGTALRSTFVIDKNGVIRHSKVYPAGTIPDPAELQEVVTQLG